MASKHKNRLPAETLNQVTSDDIDEAVQEFISGAPHNFSDSTGYDICMEDGTRLPPKAIFGLALGKRLGRKANPEDFSGGLNSICFSAIEEAGYNIIAKDEPPSTEPCDSEQTWAEGKPSRAAHLKRERAPGLARAKKRQFIRDHQRLKCERCDLIPSEQLGEHGDAVIEVHHAATAISKMTPDHRTRLSDLQCLCANCHRIVHREQLS